jgi:hypothetical protein
MVKKHMKKIPTVLASRDGRHRVEVNSFDGSDRISNRDAVGYYFRLRLEPNGDLTRVSVVFSGIVMVTTPDAFGVPASNNREENFMGFSLAALGDYLDEEGLPRFVKSGEPAPHVECFSPHFQAWADRPAASDVEIEAYLQAHVFGAWEYGHDYWEPGTSDLIRLHQDLKTVDRLIRLGATSDWSTESSTLDAVRLSAQPEFIQQMRAGRKSRTVSPIPVELSGNSEGASLQDEAARFVYIDELRLGELRGLSPAQFDLRKLISICEELNLCYRSQCYHAVTALTRALIDHVPPIFGKGSFGEVANNYQGSRSFKDCMQRLEGAARKIADGHLHTKIRRKESLLTRTQVNFSNEVDLLLAEVVRILA